MSVISFSQQAAPVDLPLPDPRGGKPLVDWHSQFGQSTAQKPIHSHYRHGDFRIISGLPEAILQNRRESSGNQRIIKLFTSAPIPAAT